MPSLRFPIYKKEIKASNDNDLDYIKYLVYIWHIRDARKILVFLAITQWFSTGSDFIPQGHLAMTRDIFDCHMGRGGELTGIRWVEAKDATMPGSLPQQRIIRLSTATVRNLSNLKVPFASTPWM